MNSSPIVTYPIGHCRILKINLQIWGSLSGGYLGQPMWRSVGSGLVKVQILCDREAPNHNRLGRLWVEKLSNSWKTVKQKHGIGILWNERTVSCGFFLLPMRHDAHIQLYDMLDSRITSFCLPVCLPQMVIVDGPGTGCSMPPIYEESTPCSLSFHYNLNWGSAWKLHVWHVWVPTNWYVWWKISSAKSKWYILFVYP